MKFGIENENHQDVSEVTHVLVYLRCRNCALHMEALSRGQLAATSRDSTAACFSSERVRFLIIPIQMNIYIYIYIIYIYIYIYIYIFLYWYY